MMDRRKFIVFLTSGFVASVAAGASAFFSWPNNISIYKRILNQGTEGLKVEESLIDKFLDDIKNKRNWNPLSKSKRNLLKIYFPLESILFLLPYQTKYKQSKAELVGWFLLSTDFFMNKMQNEKNISYVGVFDPYKGACSNPFSHLYYS